MADPTPAPTGTQTMVTTIGASVAKNILMIAGASLASHGLISGSGVETFVSLGMVLIGAAWSFYNSYGRAILKAKLEVWKAKAEAQADAMRKANVPQPTNAQIADKIPDPAVTAAVVAKAIAAVLALMIVFAVSPALAQTQNRPRALTGDLIGDIKNATASPSQRDGDDLIKALDAQLLPDLKFALNLATKSNNTITGPCYDSWIKVIEARQSANLDADGKAMAEPSPGLVTKFEKLVELRNMLQPDSDFMIKCSPVASMVRSDIRKFIGLVLTGGAGLAALGIGL